MLEKAGYDPESVLSIDITPKEFEIIPEGARVIIDAWVERAGSAIAIAIMSSISTLDFEAIVIDGDIPVNLLTKLNKRVTEELDQQDFTGLKRPKLLSGDLGNRARAMGGALLPLYSKFAPERELLFNQPNT
jgi:predicted NBD/HSP70 family sugar kinase